MNIAKSRIVPFTTLIITGSDNFEDFRNEVSEWCRSDSFNPQGKVYILDCIDKRLSVGNKYGLKDMCPTAGFSLRTIFLIVLRIKPSISIDFCLTPLSRTIQFFSRSGRTFSRRGIYSFFLTSAGYKCSGEMSLRDCIPGLFNDPGNELFGFRTTSKVKMNLRRQETTDSNQTDKSDADMNIDLGEIPAETGRRLLWVPKRTTEKGVWNDFIKLTYFAQKTNCRISAHFKTEQTFQKFSSVFFIKGRKMDLDRYITPIIGGKLNEIIFGDRGIEYEKIIFSFGITNEYRSLFFKLKKEGGQSKITTIQKIDKELK